ncbi:MAG: hypothetical protein R3321_13400, partial [Nitrososphaeraceae archaeon]|nr:hypothetical protein [Nitrososphaeraceae archaeon]
NDQYLHPHETTHTIGEVLSWFKKNNIEYLQTIPSINGNYNLEIGGVFLKERNPIYLERLYHQLTWIYKTDREGGYWITFGKKE